jgi:hypothetical protein
VAAEQVGQHEQCADCGEPAERVEQPIRDQPYIEGGLVIEVVPVKELVKHRLVYECRNTNAEQQAGKQVSTGVGRPVSRAGQHPRIAHSHSHRRPSGWSRPR